MAGVPNVERGSRRADTAAGASYVGALDGLRALAVIAVIVYHFSPSALPAGFLGVDVFFVVSGFLIARLIAREIRRTDRLRLSNFWGRRARRLLPALAVMAVAVLAAAAVSFSADELVFVRKQFLGVLFYVANWVMIAQHSSYFANVGRPSPFLHTWSLAVEEQFYLVFPLLCLAGARLIRRRPIIASGAALVAAIASTIWMAVLVAPDGDPSRAYLGTDSHCMGLFVGVALALFACSPSADTTLRWLHSHPTATRAASASAGVAAGAVALTMWLCSDRTLGLYRGGFLAVSLACGWLIAVLVAVPDSAIARFFRTPLLVSIGLRSYALYLWHWPVRVFVDGSDGLSGPALFVVRLALSFALAEISFRLVERPFRNGVIARRTGSRGAVAFYAAAALVCVLLAATVAVPVNPTPTRLANIEPTLARPRPGVRHFDVFGDSTALQFAYRGALHASELNIEIDGDARLGCGVVPGSPIIGGHSVAPPADCAGWQARWQAALKRTSTATPLVMTGAWDIYDHEIDGTRVRFGTQAWHDLVFNSTRAALQLLTVKSATVYLFELPCFGAGDVTVPSQERSDPTRIAAMNAIYQQIAATTPRVQIIRWRTLVCPDGHRVETIDHARLWQADEAHLTEGGAVVVWKWLLKQYPRI